MCSRQILLSLLLGLSAFSRAHARQPAKKPPPPPPPAERRDASAERMVNATVEKHFDAMKLCYARVSRHDPTLRSTKLIVKLHVESTGLVTDVNFGQSAAGREALCVCLAASMKQWEFPQAAKEYEVAFPLLSVSD
jgi:hypothetical protein